MINSMSLFGNFRGGLVVVVAAKVKTVKMFLIANIRVPFHLLAKLF